MKKFLCILLAFTLASSLLSCLEDYIVVQDRTAADNFIELVNQLPEDPEEITLEHKSAIEAAENAYKLLSGRLKKEQDVAAAKHLLDSLREAYNLLASEFGIILDRTSLVIKESETYTLTVTLIEEFEGETVTWASDNTDVATVSSEGVVTGVSEGTANITASISNGFSATCVVTVEKLLAPIDFDESECTFYDKFDGNSVDTSKWVFQNGNGSKFGIKGWGNNEKQYYQPQNATVANGLLTITAKIEPKSEDGYSTKYTSAKLVTQGKFSQTYGKFEARIRLTKELQGLWPAFWMMPEGSVYGGWPNSGEIDIMEMKGRFPTNASSAIHFKRKSGSSEWNDYLHKDYTFPNGGRITDFHIYGVIWTPEKIQFTIDGVPYHTRYPQEWVSQKYTGNQPFDKPFYIILNFAIGGNFDGGLLPPDDQMPAALEIDFVRVYAYDPATM